MSKRRIAAILAGTVTMFAVALTGCSAQSSAVPSGAATTTRATINFVASDDPSTYTAVIKSFEQANPEITVKYTQIPFSAYDSTIQQRLSAKDSSIDVLAVDQPRMSQLAAEGLLVNLSSLKSQAKSAVSASQYDVSLYKGELWALPLNNSTQLLYYNKDLLSAAHQPAPAADPSKRLTWESVETSAKAVTATAKAKYGILFEQPTAYYEIEPLIVSAGGGTGITGADALTAEVETAGWQKALSWYAGLYSSGLSPRGLGDFQTNTAFQQGDAPYFIGGNWDVSEFAGVKFDWGVAPEPYFAGGQRSTPTGSWSLGINQASKNTADAEAFIKYLTLNTQGATLANETAGNLPSNTAAQAAYLSKLNGTAGAHSAGAKEIISYEIAHTATARPASVGYPQFEDAVNKAISDIVNGSAVLARLQELQGAITRSWQALH